MVLSRCFGRQERLKFEIQLMKYYFSPQAESPLSERQRIEIENQLELRKAVIQSIRVIMDRHFSVHEFHILD